MGLFSFLKKKNEEINAKCNSISEQLQERNAAKTAEFESKKEALLQKMNTGSKIPKDKTGKSINERNSPPKAKTSSKAGPSDGKKHRVTGVKYYEENILKLAKENPDYRLTKDKIINAGLVENNIYKYLFPDGPVSLEQEPDNSHDPNAIKVILAGQHIGYIKAGSCARLNKAIREKRIVKITCKLYGGPYKAVCNENYDVDSPKPDYQLDKGTAEFRAEIRVFEVATN